MNNTEKRLEQIKQIIYGNARKGAVTDDLNQIIGLRTGEGLEFENLAKGLTEYVEDEIHQAITEERARVREIQNPYKEFNQEALNRMDTWKEWAFLEHGKRMGFGRCKAELLSSLDKLTNKE